MLYIFNNNRYFPLLTRKSHAFYIAGLKIGNILNMKLLGKLLRKKLSLTKRSFCETNIFKYKCVI